jgi:cellulose synthase/poly-beta-1,6-N-acetylglucosamine synthase-like glycosyltransferase
MTPEIINFVPPQPRVAEVEIEAPSNLSSHMRQLRRWNQGASRWLALAVLTGAVAALAFVRFLAR